MRLEKSKLISLCDNIALCSIYAVAYFIPISKALVETFTYMAIGFFLIRKFLESRDIAEKDSISLSVVFYVLVCFFSIFISSKSSISFRSFIAKVIQDVFFFFTAADTLRKEKRLKVFLGIFFASSLLLGIDGIYQHFTHKDFIRNRPDLILQRIYASFNTPNDFSCYLVCVIPLAIAFFFGRPRLKPIPIFIASLFMLLFVCLILTVSRGAWFAFLAVLFFMCAWIKPLRLVVLFLVLFVAATKFLFPPLVRQRFGDFFVFKDISSQDRKMIWAAGWKMFLSHPILGLGLGTFMFNFETFVVKGYPYGIPYAHNCYLQMMAEIGIIGLLAFLLILFFIFFHACRTLKSAQRSFAWYSLLGSTAAVLGYCVSMGLDTFLYQVDLGILFWLLMGMAVASMNIIKSGKASDIRRA